MRKVNQDRLFSIVRKNKIETRSSIKLTFKSIKYSYCEPHCPDSPITSHLIMTAKIKR